VRRETHVAKVLANADPGKAGGARVQATDLVDGPLDPEDFVPGRFPTAGDDEGYYFAPSKGAQVELEALADDAEGVEDLGARWVGMIYSDKDKIPEEFRSNAVDRGGIKWGTEVLLFDRAAKLLSLISGNVRLGEEGATEAVLRGTTFNVELSTFLTDLATAFGALAAASTGPLAPLAAGFGQAQTACTVFSAKVSTWLSTKVKTE
jgi:hypothetical protein